jgi:hypothetical protein
MDADGGTGGASGSGGSSAGSGGKDGGTDAAVVCSDLAARYGDALATARHCLVGATDQCAQSAFASLSGCIGCKVPVNGSAALDQLKAAWDQAGCGTRQGPLPCPGIVCINPNGVCQAADGGGGLCVSQGIR